jgi:hypothetical protein
MIQQQQLVDAQTRALEQQARQQSLPQQQPGKHDITCSLETDVMPRGMRTCIVCPVGANVIRYCQ